MNETALDEFNQQINTQANLRDYLMPFTQNLVIASALSIELQASFLAQLTDTQCFDCRDQELMSNEYSSIRCKSCEEFSRRL